MSQQWNPSLYPGQSNMPTYFSFDGEPQNNPQTPDYDPFGVQQWPPLLSGPHESKDFNTVDPTSGTTHEPTNEMNHPQPPFVIRPVQGGSFPPTHTVPFNPYPVQHYPNSGSSSLLPQGAVNTDFMDRHSSPPMSSPEPMQPHGFNSPTPLPYPVLEAGHGTKRPQETTEFPQDDGTRQGAKKIPGRACQRCKTQKTRCEFIVPDDCCLRCLNSGSECFIPGRKKRRTPPKREHLLNQIREKDVEIQQLKKQLGQQAQSSDNLFSPVDAAEADGAKPEIQDWIEKESDQTEELPAAAVPKRVVADSDDSESSEGEAEYEYGIEGYEEDDRPEGELSEELNAVNSHVGRLVIKTPMAGQEGFPRSKTRDRNSFSDKLANLPPDPAPFGLFAKASRTLPDRADSGDNDLGVGGKTFFAPSPIGADVDSQKSQRTRQGPNILTRRIITPAEADKLFDIYFSYMNISCSLLDPALYTAPKAYKRSLFLFTVVCAVASRYYPERTDLYTKLMSCAQQAAGQALITGEKSVETVQAYLLLSLYPVPVRKFDENRRWIYLGLAIRFATDMNLHTPVKKHSTSMSEQHARYLLNRTRVWLNCFNLDRSTGSEYGKPPIIKNSDYVANHSESWWSESPYNVKHFDIHLCAYNAELKVMGKFQERIYNDPHHPTGLNKAADFEKIASETDDQLQALKNTWFEVIGKTDMSNPQNRFRTGLLRLAYSYARLVALSFGFQHAVDKTLTADNPLLNRCLRAAFDVVHSVVHELGLPEQRIYLRHGPEAQSVFLTFACTFLIKLLQPKFASCLTIERRREIRSLVQEAVNLLQSPEVAIDERHGPRLYAKFLKRLLNSPLAALEPQSPGRSPTSTSSRRSQPPVVPPTSPATQDHSRIVNDLSAHPLPQTHDAPSPASSASLSPPNEAASSFDHFAPESGIDPFAYMMDTEHSMSIADFPSQFPLDGIVPAQDPWGVVDPNDFGWEGLDLMHTDNPGYTGPFYFPHP